MSSQNRVSPEPGAEEVGVRYRGSESYLMETRCPGSSITDIRVPNCSQGSSITDVHIPSAPQQANYLEPGQESFPQRRENAWGDDCYNDDLQKETSHQGSVLTVNTDNSQITASQPDSGFIADHHFDSSQKEAKNQDNNWSEGHHKDNEDEVHRVRNAWADPYPYKTDHVDNSSSEGHKDSKQKERAGPSLAFAATNDNTQPLTALPEHSRTVSSHDDSSRKNTGQQKTAQNWLPRKHKEDIQDWAYDDNVPIKDFPLPNIERPNDRIIGGKHSLF
ncbi:uncharacterized protein LOC110448522 [Mizuhopecten yessoensis]|uniref:uncharacterized protein LOC110448522 n=1 Tax=Mizuhopecten yessoensis TaxID=6573 RepID=UPI000B45AE1A|nr:uncharacterized protein LOC110448522 [Mizuhopecten yessoensis]